MRTPTVWLTSFVLLVSASVPNAQDVVVKIAKVPDCLPDVTRDALLRERSGVTDQFKEYNNKVDEFRGRCSLVREGTELYYSCLTEQNNLNERLEELREAAASFKIKVDSAVGSVRTAFNQRIADLRRQIENDETAIRGMGFEKRAEELNDWINLAAHAQQEFERQTRKALIDLAIENAFSGVKRGVMNVGSFNPPQAIHLIRQLKSLGVSDLYLFGAIRRLALVRGKPARARAVNLLLDRVKKAVELARKEDSQTKLDGFAGLLAVVVEDPRLSILLKEMKFATAAVYNNAAQRVSQHQVMRLTALTQEQLKVLQKVLKLLEEHVGQLNDVKRKLASLCETNEHGSGSE